MRERTRQDAPGTTIGIAADLQVSPSSGSHIITGIFSGLSRHGTFSRRRRGAWTLTSLWTQRTRPQVTLKTADSFQQRPHPISFSSTKKEEPKNEERTTRNSAT